MKFVADQVIDGTLRLVAPLGRGAMGVLWKAEHLRLNRMVAIKFMLAANANPRARQRFDDEAAKIASIKSHHVVRVLGTGQVDDNLPYIVMELLEGEVLRDRLKRQKTPPLDIVVRIISQLADGLGAAHAADIVHRDLKPGNVFLLSSSVPGLPRAKIIDFGLAKWLGGSQITRQGALLGTPYYMSREQVSDPGSVDHRADLWSLAVLAYEMVTGQRPFTGPHPGAVFDAIAAGDFEPPSDVRPGMTDEVDDFFDKALARDPDQRYPDAIRFARGFATAMATVNRLSADVWPVGGPGRNDAPLSGPMDDDDIIEPLGASRYEEPNDDVG